MRLWTKDANYALNQLSHFQMSYTSFAKLTEEPSLFFFSLMISDSCYCSHCTLMNSMWFLPLIHLYRVLKLEPCDLEAVLEKRVYSNPRWCRCDPVIHSQLCDKLVMLLSMWQCQYDPVMPAKQSQEEQASIRREHKNYYIKPTYLKRFRYCKHEYAIRRSNWLTSFQSATIFIIENDRSDIFFHLKSTLTKPYFKGLMLYSLLLKKTNPKMNFQPILHPPSASVAYL